jgi:hypothetical protein
VTALELFSCAVYSCRLTRSACAQRHAAASAPWSTGERGSARLQFMQCRGCAIGAAHARGEQPDVDVAALVRREGGAAMPMPAKTYDGKTIKEWAASADNKHGLPISTIKSRLRTGMDISAALAPKAKGKIRRKKDEGVGGRDAPLVARVRDALTALPAVELLQRLGYPAEDAGTVPAGQLIVVRGEAGVE